MATALKPEAYPGVQLLAAASIEANSVEQSLRGAQFRFDRALHELRSEFIVRENKLRDEYLAEVAETRRPTAINRPAGRGRRNGPGRHSRLIEERFSDSIGLEKEPEPPLTEPEIITCEFATGCAVDADEHALRLTGWTFIPPYFGGECAERRIVVRFAMPIGAARALRTEARRGALAMTAKAKPRKGGAKAPPVKPTRPCTPREVSENREAFRPSQMASGGLRISSGDGFH
jgi:hypothetical protein